MSELIHVRDNIYRRPYRRPNGRASNVYFVYVPCAGCTKLVFQARRNNRRSQPTCSAACRRKIDKRIAGRRYKYSGHVLLYRPDHPNAVHSYVPEHRLIIEESVGRYLTAKEVVHHINCIKDDNRPDNLLLCANSSDHHKVHKSFYTCIPELMKLGILVFDRSTRKYAIADAAKQ